MKKLSSKDSKHTLVQQYGVVKVTKGKLAIGKYSGKTSLAGGASHYAGHVVKRDKQTGRISFHAKKDEKISS